jgi:hypothetical protein
MSAIQAETLPRLTTTAIAHELETHPSAPVRWIQKGSLLSNGSRLKLKAEATPGGWRVRREDLDEFLRVLTADRLGSDVEQQVPRPANSSRLAKVRAALTEAGF